MIFLTPILTNTNLKKTCETWSLRSFDQWSFQLWIYLATFGKWYKLVSSKQFSTILGLKLLGLATLISCSPVATNLASSLPPPSQSSQVFQMNNTIKFEIFDVGYSPLEEGFSLEPQVLVFRDEQAWSHFWQSSSFYRY